MNDDLFDELFYRATMEGDKPGYATVSLTCPGCGTENEEADWQEGFFECVNCHVDYDLSVCQDCDGRYGLALFSDVDICPHCGAEQEEEQSQ